MTNLLFCALATVSDDSKYERYSNAVDKYYNTVKELCKKLAGESSLADEAESRVWYFLLDHIEKLEGRSEDEAYAYLYQTVVSAVAYCKDENRRQDLSSVVSVPLSREIRGFERYDTASDPEREAIYREIKELFIKYLEAIDEGDLSMLYLRFFEGYSLGEIAKVMNIPKSTVAYRIKRHLIELKTKYTGGLGDE